jgi:HEAT repeat protein
VRHAETEKYLDQGDASSSTARLLIWQALRAYPFKGLRRLLHDNDVIVRTAAARELQLRGGSRVWRLTRALCKSASTADRVIGLFIIGQLGTPNLPYQKASFQLIYELLRRTRSPVITENALYAIGHLRKGAPVAHKELQAWIKKLNVRENAHLREARKFALGGRN